MINHYILSTYRAQLMGISILMIMIFHSFLGLEGNITYTYISTFDIGVEYFAILSAMGCGYSFSKNPDVSAFYKKRVLRLLPSVLIAGALMQLRLYNGEEPLMYIIKATGFACMFGDVTLWFIGYIMICYLLLPYIYKVIERTNKNIFPLLILVTYATCCAIGKVTQWSMVLERIPVFILGVMMMKSIKSKKEINLGTLIQISLIGIIVIPIGASYHLSSSYMRFLYLLFSYPLLLLIGLTLQFFPQIINKCLAFLGTITLELYLLHEFLIYQILPHLYFVDVINKMIIAIVAIIAAWAFQMCITFTINKITIRNK